MSLICVLWSTHKHPDDKAEDFLYEHSLNNNISIVVDVEQMQTNQLLQLNTPNRNDTLKQVGRQPKHITYSHYTSLGTISANVKPLLEKLRILLKGCRIIKPDAIRMGRKTNFRPFQSEDMR